MNDALIEFRDVSVGYRRGEPVLGGLSFAVRPGDFLALIGPNGAGKSTILKTLLGLLPPLAGKIERHEEGLRYGYVQQRQYIDEIFPLSVREVVMMGRYGMIGPVHRPRKEDRAAVDEALATVGISGLAKIPYRDLSGGQKQRTLIARALASDPSLLVLDEPTNDLDARGERQVMELLRELNGRGKTILVVSHLLHVVAQYARAFIEIEQDNGKKTVVSRGSASTSL